ncbi:MAG TPA: hypothetical protein VKF42_02880 [Chitinivibrionales bacterium]|jgi:hypothetical protein|nr:hypothetical protein [Chitinivibrionales bacterium]
MGVKENVNYDMKEELGVPPFGETQDKTEEVLGAPLLRSGGPPSSPAWRTAEEIYSAKYFFAPAGILGTNVGSLSQVPLPTVNFQLSFSVPPQQSFLSRKSIFLGATHEGVCPKTPQAREARRGGLGPGGHLPRQEFILVYSNYIFNPELEYFLNL